MCGHSFTRSTYSGNGIFSLSRLRWGKRDFYIIASSLDTVPRDITFHWIGVEWHICCVRLQWKGFTYGLKLGVLDGFAQDAARMDAPVLLSALRRGQRKARMRNRMPARWKAIRDVPLLQDTAGSLCPPPNPPKLKSHLAWTFEGEIACWRQGSVRYV